MATRLLVVASLLSSSAWSAFPQNSLRIPAPRSASESGEVEFVRVATQLLNAYSGEVAARGMTLDILANWENPSVNAFTYRSGKRIQIVLAGGLARHPLLTSDGFSLVICHEIGHHLGGFPETISRGYSASVEGQADYFATLKCARKIWKDEDNAAAISGRQVPQLISESCKKQFPDPNAATLCQRSALASLSMTDTLSAITQDLELKRLDQGLPDISTPDLTEVTATNFGYPGVQCRLDTYWAGALCTADPDEAISATDAQGGACSEEAGESVGFRPRCWYRPGK